VLRAGRMDLFVIGNFSARCAPRHNCPPGAAVRRGPYERRWVGRRRSTRPMRDSCYSARPRCFYHHAAAREMPTVPARDSRFNREIVIPRI
jgi:hypothetical protein